MSPEKSCEVLGAMSLSERSALFRKQRLKDAGGRHSSTERRRIVELQEGRCIYCNEVFTKKGPPTRDHLLSIANGGAHWAINIVMACGSCNSRRRDIPFRTYCRLLSATQNRRILSHLRRRLLALDIDKLSSEAFASFHDGLSLHDPRHPRYLMIQRDSLTARGNAARNQLLPRPANLILSA
jgi:5-methylcytosine-specific restriction endonuclease McrA